MAKQQAGQRLVAGQVIAASTFLAVDGASVDIPDPRLLVHLQFRRFAGCPLCNLHLRSFIRRHNEIATAGVREVVMFHSTARELRAHTADLPFAVIADPDKRLYAEFGVEVGLRALLDPRVWGRIGQAIARDLSAILRRRQPPPNLRQPNGRLGLPADFLIAGDGRLVAVKYGSHAYDQWTVDELLGLAHTETRKDLDAIDHSHLPAAPDHGQAMTMGAILNADPERDLAAFLAALPEQLALGDQEPATIVDRYYSPDFEQYNDGIRLDRDKLIGHARPARKNVASVRTDVHDVLVSGDRFAARYTMHVHMRKGAIIVNEVYMLGRLAPDGRIRRIDSTTRTLSPD